MSVSIIIPTRNEPLIQQLVNEIHQCLNAVKHDIIVIDKSEEKPKIQGATLLQQHGSGLGQAVLEALPHARGDLILTMDGDYSHDPHDLPRLIEASRQHDLVFGSRFVKGGRNLDYRSRKYVSTTYRFLARRILRLPLEDPMSGFCIARRRVYDAIRLDPLGYKINVELAYKARKKGYTIAEIPISFYPRRAGKSKAGTREGLRTLLFIFALRFNLR